MRLAKGSIEDGHPRDPVTGKPLEWSRRPPDCTSAVDWIFILHGAGGGGHFWTITNIAPKSRAGEKNLCVLYDTNLRPGDKLVGPRRAPNVALSRAVAAAAFGCKLDAVRFHPGKTQLQAGSGGLANCCGPLSFLNCFLLAAEKRPGFFFASEPKLRLFLSNALRRGDLPSIEECMRGSHTSPGHLTPIDDG